MQQASFTKTETQKEINEAKNRFWFKINCFNYGEWQWTVNQNSQSKLEFFIHFFIIESVLNILIKLRLIVHKRQREREMWVTLGKNFLEVKRIKKKYPIHKCKEKDLIMLISRLKNICFWFDGFALSKNHLIIIKNLNE